MRASSSLAVPTVINFKTNWKMKELKDFLQEVESNPLLIEADNVAETDLIRKEVKRIVSEAYIAGINFQDSQKKKGQ